MKYKPYYIVSASDTYLHNICLTKEKANIERQRLKSTGYTKTYIKKVKGPTALSDYN